MVHRRMWGQATEYFKFNNSDRNLRAHENYVKMVTASKQYKIQIKKPFRVHQNLIIKTIRCLKSSDPKQCWELLFENVNKIIQNTLIFVLFYRISEAVAR